MSKNGVSSSNKTLNWILYLALNQGVLVKNKSKVKMISSKSRQEGFSAHLRQDQESAETCMVRMKTNYQEMSERLGSKHFEDVSNEKDGALLFVALNVNAKIVIECVSGVHF